MSSSPIPRQRPRARVFRVSLDEPLRPLALGPGYFKAVLVVASQGAVVGHVDVPGLEVVPVEVQRDAIAERLGVALLRREAKAAVRRACGLTRQAAAARRPTVSVVVCTRDRPDDLSRCLASLAALATRPAEIVVVDNSPSDDRARQLCAAFGVRYVREPVPGQARARNRGIVESDGELVAFTDDDCVVDPAWLDGLGAELDDPLVLALTGYVGPLELDAPAQLQFEAHGGFQRGFARRVFDGVRVNAALAAGQSGAGANAIFRRSAFERLGLFAEDFGPGTPARAADDNDMFCRILDAGYRIAFDPTRIVWHRHRRDEDALARIVHDYGVSSSALAARRLVRDRDLSALRIPAWWWLEHCPRDIRALVRRHPARLPARAVAAELAGTLVGPWQLWQSARSRRGIPPLAPVAPAARPDVAVQVTSAAPSVSVVVPTRDRRALLRQTLAGLAAQSFPAERLEVVVVLDGSADGSAEMLDGLEVPFRLTTVETRGAGVAAARNRGVQAARGPIVLFLDDDTVPERSCVAAHARAHADAPRDHVALGYCPPVVGDGWFGQFLRGWWEDHYRHKREQAHRWTFYDFVTGNTSLPKDVLLEAGGFDESFAARHEDWELGIRLLDAGIPFRFYSDTTARHHLDTSLSHAVRQQRLEAHGDVLLARRHPRIARQLPLAGYAAGLPPATARTVERALRRAERCERLRLRARWARRAAFALRDAYVLGLRDVLPTTASLRALLEASSPETIRVPLDGSAPLALPSLGHLELALELDGRTVARVDPLPPGRQWSWQDAVDSVSSTAWPELRVALLQRELRRLAAARAGEREREDAIHAV